MDHKLTPPEKELYRRVDEVIHYLWDPIGVSGIPQARDEYYSYYPKVFALLQEKRDDNEISEYLLKIQKNMGLPVGPESEKRAEEITKILIEYRDWIENTNTWRK